MTEWIRDPAILASHLADESGRTGAAEAVIFPETVEDVAAAVRQAAVDGQTLTIQGSKTGVCAGAVPAGGSILNLSCLNDVTAFSYDAEQHAGTITVQAGCTLAMVTDFLAGKRPAPQNWSHESQDAWDRYAASGDVLWFLPNPTETTASLGGMVATGASGSRVAAGGMVDHIASMTAVRANGSIEPAASLCGSEGVLGIVVDVTLRLSAKPSHLYGLLTFHKGYAAASAYCDQMAAHRGIVALDWFDIACRDLLAGHAATLPPHSFIPDFPPGATVCVWTEAAGTEDDLFVFLSEAMAILDADGSFADAALAATDDRDRERVGAFRHLVTETCNRLAAGTRAPILDWRAPVEQWVALANDIAALLRRDDIPFALMGHARDGRASARLAAPRDAGALIDFLKTAGCAASGEHGFGRAKRGLLHALNPEEQDRWRRLRAEADPAGVLNPRVLALR